jgi:hypothetical protein
MVWITFQKRTSCGNRPEDQVGGRINTAIAMIENGAIPRIPHHRVNGRFFEAFRTRKVLKKDIDAGPYVVRSEEGQIRLVGERIVQLLWVHSLGELLG